MTRIVKEADERRNEILDAAETVSYTHLRHPLSGYFHVWRITAYDKSKPAGNVPAY